MAEEHLPIELPVRIPSHPIEMEELVSHLQLSPRPHYLSHPIRALLTFVQEFIEDRRLRSHSFFSESTEHENFIGNLNADSRFLPCGDILFRLDREIHVVCGRMGYKPNEVREELAPLWADLVPMMNWAGVCCEFHKHLQFHNDNWNPHNFLPPNTTREDLLRHIAVGRMLTEKFEPTHERVLNLWDNVRGREENIETFIRVTPNMLPRDWNSPSQKRIDHLLQLLQRSAPQSDSELHALCTRLIEWYGYQEELLKATPEGRIAHSRGDYSHTFEPLWDIVRQRAGNSAFPPRPESMTGLSPNEAKREVERVMNWCTRSVQVPLAPESRGPKTVGRKKPVRVLPKWRKILGQWKKHQADMEKAGKRATLTDNGTFSLHLPTIKVFLAGKELAEFRAWYNGQFKPSLPKPTSV